MAMGKGKGKGKEGRIQDLKLGEAQMNWKKFKSPWGGGGGGGGGGGYLKYD